MSTVDPKSKLTIEIPGTVDAEIHIPVSLESSPTLANMTRHGGVSRREEISNHRRLT